MQFGSPVASLLGGALIGLASALVLLIHGRIAGISGILKGGLHAIVSRVTEGSSLQQDDQRIFQVSFLLGLIGTGAVTLAVAPSALSATSGTTLIVTIGSGLLVGFGTALGSGCTSGHGVCGIGRGSLRSLVAVMTFMLVAMITVAIKGNV
jgi:uncharacterized protein